MDPFVISAWSRALERIAIVGLSGLSLILGWDLFRRGVLDSQRAEFKAHTWSARLQHVGPGIFFALFATVAFVSAISHPLEITTGKKAEEQPRATAVSAVPSRTAEEDKLVYAEKAGASNDRDVVAAINTFHLLALPPLSQRLDEGNRNAINKADQTLDVYKRSLMFAHFGQMSLQFYSIHDKVSYDPAVLRQQSADFQNTYSEIEAWDHDTFLRSR